MTWHDAMAHFIGGVFFANFFPQFVSGVSDRSFPSTFGKPPFRGLSSPAVNVLWGSSTSRWLASCSWSTGRSSYGKWPRLASRRRASDTALSALRGRREDFRTVRSSGWCLRAAHTVSRAPPGAPRGWGRGARAARRPDSRATGTSGVRHRSPSRRGASWLPSRRSQERGCGSAMQRSRPPSQGASPPTDGRSHRSVSSPARTCRSAQRGRCWRGPKGTAKGCTGLESPRPVGDVLELVEEPLLVVLRHLDPPCAA